jgi:hypothetical protein
MHLNPLAATATLALLLAMPLSAASADTAATTARVGVAANADVVDVILCHPDYDGGALRAWDGGLYVSITYAIRCETITEKTPDAPELVFSIRSTSTFDAVGHLPVRIAPMEKGGPSPRLAQGIYSDWGILRDTVCSIPFVPDEVEAACLGTGPSAWQWGWSYSKVHYTYGERCLKQACMNSGTAVHKMNAKVYVDKDRGFRLWGYGGCVDTSVATDDVYTLTCALTLEQSVAVHHPDDPRDVANNPREKADQTREEADDNAAAAQDEAQGTADDECQMGRPACS